MKWQTYTLKNPYHFQGQLRESKDSLLLTFEMGKEKIISECSIFPGLHQLERGFYQKLGENLPKLFKPTRPFKNLAEILEQTKEISTLPANLLFAFESALVQYWGNHQLLPTTWQKVFNQSEIKISIQELMTNPQSQPIPRSHTVKCKLGRGPNTQSDITLFQKLHSQRPQTKWRIDANNSYHKEDLELWASLLTKEQRESIDYFENPCQDPADWNESLQLPLALETGAETKESWWAQDFKLKAIVHKPSVTLGFFQTCQFVINSKTEVVISSSFEGPYGLRDLLTLCAFLNLKNPQGLGTLEQLKLNESVNGLIQTDNELSLQRKNFTT